MKELMISKELITLIVINLTAVFFLVVYLIASVKKNALLDKIVSATIGVVAWELGKYVSSLF